MERLDQDRDGSLGEGRQQMREKRRIFHNKTGNNDRNTRVCTENSISAWSQARDTSASAVRTRKCNDWMSLKLTLALQITLVCIVRWGLWEETDTTLADGRDVTANTPRPARTTERTGHKWSCPQCTQLQLLLGEATSKLHCAEFEHEQLQAWADLLSLRHTNRLTTHLYASRGHPGTLSLGRQRRTHKHSTAASCHLSNLRGEGRSRCCYVRKAEAFTDGSFSLFIHLGFIPNLKDWRCNWSFINIHLLMDDM